MVIGKTRSRDRCGSISAIMFSFRHHGESPFWKGADMQFHARSKVEAGAASGRLGDFTMAEVDVVNLFGIRETCAEFLPAITWERWCTAEDDKASLPG